jgi:hypothetical protein
MASRSAIRGAGLGKRLLDVSSGALELRHAQRQLEADEVLNTVTRERQPLRAQGA